MQVKELRAAFERDGFVLIEDFFARELMDQLDRRIRAHYGDAPAFEHTDEFLERSRTDVIPWFPQEDGPSAFDAIDQDPRLDALTTAILGEDWARVCCMVMYSMPGSAGQAWHQDCEPEDEATYNLNRLVYCHDVTAATGGETVVVPGSHRRGLLPAGDPTGLFAGQQVLRPKKGSLLLLHGHAWHRVLPMGRASRHSINYRAVPRGTRTDVTDVCVYRNMRYRFSTSELIEERTAR